MKSQHYLAAFAGLALASIPLNAASLVTGAFSNNSTSLQTLSEGDIGDEGGSMITHFTVGAANLKITSLGIFRSNYNGQNFDTNNLAPLTTGADFGFTSANPLQLRLYKADTTSTGGSGGTEVRAETSAGFIANAVFDDTFLVTGVSGVVTGTLGSAYVYQQAAPDLVLEAGSTYIITSYGWSPTPSAQINTGTQEFTYGRRLVGATGQNAADETNTSLFTIGFSTYTGNAGDRGPLGLTSKWSNLDNGGGTRWAHASFTAETTLLPPTDPGNEPPETSPIPEPSSALLLLTSLTAMLFRRQRG